MPEEKFDDQIGVKCHARFKDALDRIAQANNLEKGASLLRIAGQAIIEYATAHGDTAVPLDMAIAQAPKTVDLAMVAEGPGQEYNSVRDVVAEAKAALQPQAPTPAPLCLPKSPLSAAGSRGKKSRRKRGGG
jgi:hypothetical protein